MKCQSCNLKKIKKILFYDFVVQKCKSCEYIRMFSDDFELLKYQVLYSKNVGNIKKHEDLNLYSELEKKYIEDFLKCFLTKKKIIENNNEVCDICTDKLKKINVNGFVYYECNYCNSIYFGFLSLKHIIFLVFTLFFGSQHSLIRFESLLSV